MRNFRAAWIFFRQHFPCNNFFKAIKIFFRVNWRAWFFFQFPLPPISFLFLNMKISLFYLSKYRTHERSIWFDLIPFHTAWFDLVRFVRGSNQFRSMPMAELSGKWKFCSILFAGHNDGKWDSAKHLHHQLLVLDLVLDLTIKRVWARQNFLNRSPRCPRIDSRSRWKEYWNIIVNFHSHFPVSPCGAMD